METIGLRIARLRREKKLSVAQISRELKVSASTLRDWEYGRSIKGEPYVPLAKVLGVSVHYLLTGEKSTRGDLGKAVRLLNEAIEIIRRNDDSPPK